VAANCSYTTESLPHEQPKVVLNNTRRPSRRGFVRLFAFSKRAFGAP
jgi:hypothetical protein